MKKLLFTFVLFLITIPLAAQTTIIEAEGYIDVASGKLVTPANIVVSDGVITSINPRNIPQEAKTIDLSGKILLPGFMDMHTHLDMNFVTGGFEFVVTENGSEGALRAAKNAKKTLMAGFTTVRNMGQVHPSIELINVALGDAIKQEWIPGPRVIASGHMISILGGHGDLSMGEGLAEGILELGPERGVISGVDDAIKATRFQIKHGAKNIKIHATAGVLSTEEKVGAQQLSDEEMRAIVEEAERHDIPVGAHAHGTKGIKAAIRAGVSSIDHGSILDDEAIKLLKEHDVCLVPTTGLWDKMNLGKLSSQKREKAEYVLPRAKESLANAIDAGVKIALGTDSPLVPHGENAYEIIAMVRRGMSPAQALRSATIIPAGLIRMQDEIGQIKEGMLADIIAVNKNPLEFIEAVENVSFVMKEGIVYKRE